MDNDSEKSPAGWNPTPLYAGQIKPLHRHTSPSSTESSVKTGKERVNVDPGNEKMEKILDMNELAIRKLAKRHKTVFHLILPSRTCLNVDVSLNLLCKETSTFERMRPTFATGKLPGNYPEQFFIFPGLSSFHTAVNFRLKCFFLTRPWLTTVLPLVVIFRSFLLTEESIINLLINTRKSLL